MFQITKKQSSGNDLFTITYMKTVKDVNGKDVTIVDRTEEITLDNLTFQLEDLQKRIVDVQAKINAINQIK